MLRTDSSHPGLFVAFLVNVRRRLLCGRGWNGKNYNDLVGFS